MKHHKVAIFSILALLGLALALAAIPATQVKPATRHRTETSIRVDVDDLVRDIERAFEALDSIDGLNVRIRGPRRFSLDVDLRGLRAMVRDLARLGDRLDRRYGSCDKDSRRAQHRRLTADEKRQLRRALRKLRTLDIDVDIDFD
jgi:hypothetical protein